MKCQYPHPTKKCDRDAVFEHDGAYLCARHYYAQVKGWDWVKKMQDIMKHIK